VPILLVQEKSILTAQNRMEDLIEEVSSRNTSVERLHEIALYSADMLLLRALAANSTISIDIAELVAEELPELLRNPAFVGLSQTHPERVEKIFSTHRDKLDRFGLV
jgi:hypothetical protein